jgi:hypothetical protein
VPTKQDFANFRKWTKKFARRASRREPFLSETPDGVSQDSQPLGRGGKGREEVEVEGNSRPALAFPPKNFSAKL